MELPSVVGVEGDNHGEDIIISEHGKSDVYLYYFLHFNVMNNSVKNCQYYGSLTCGV